MDHNTINNALVTIKDFLGTEQGLTISCFVAYLTSLRKQTVIDHPVRSIFSGVIGAEIVSRIFSLFTPITMRSYSTAGIFGLSFIGLICKLFRKDLPEPPSSLTKSVKSTKYSDTILGGPFVKLTYKTLSSPPYSSSTFNEITVDDKDTLDMYRVSYTVHKKLVNEGKKLTCNGELTTDKILMLFNQECYFDSVIIKNVEMIRTILNSMDLKQTNGVFIHGSVCGYMMIVSDEVTTNLVVSINID